MTVPLRKSASGPVRNAIVAAIDRESTAPNSERCTFFSTIDGWRAAPSPVSRSPGANTRLRCCRRHIPGRRYSTALQRSLAGRVVSLSGIPEFGRKRGDVHQAAIFPSHHETERVLRGEEGPAEVDPDHLVPILCRHPHQGWSLVIAAFSTRPSSLPSSVAVVTICLAVASSPTSPISGCSERKRRRECVQAGRGRPVIRDDGIAPAQQRLGDQQSQPAAGAGQGHHPAF